MSDRPILEIDHLLTYVRDLDAAAALLARMGFTLTPPSRIETMAISNQLVLMHPATAATGNFIELMAAHDRDRLPPVMARTLAGEEGIKSMVLAAADAHAARDALLAQGFSVDPPAHVRREWPIGGGESVFPEFDVLLPVDAPLVFNCCRYFNVELYQRPQWLGHANGARYLRSVLAVADQPRNVAQIFAGIFGRAAGGSAAVARVSPGAVELVLMTPAALRDQYGLQAAAPPRGARYVGYLIEVAALDRLRACLANGRVPHRDSDAKVCIEPQAGLGNLIVFQPAP